MSAETLARCPVDDWTFVPGYTDGVCPLCGWRPEGIEATSPRHARLDWFWPALVALVLASIVMGTLVVLTYG